MTIDAVPSEMLPGNDQGVTRRIVLHELLDASMAVHQADNELSAACFRRNARQLPDGLSVLDDGFSLAGATCHFIRCASEGQSTLTLSLVGAYALNDCPSGGWWLDPSLEAQPVYWIPVSPVHRSLDGDGHILSEVPIQIIGLSVTSTGSSITLEAVPSMQLDLVIWRFAARARDLVRELAKPLGIELQPVFLWSSHTVYAQPSDFYRHLVFGHVYENNTVWPRYWKVCSELDGYALYVALSGLEQSTGKNFYRLLKRQLAFSVIARQAEDGGWYHGEWTDNMESHYRLHCGGIYLLAAAYEEEREPAILHALEKAVAFISQKTDQTSFGTWFLHDSLEQNHETMRQSPFPWVASHALGKSATNMLVLNTHLDTILAILRYQDVSGDQRYGAQLESACATAGVVMNLKPAETMYRILFWAIGLTLLPTEEAKQLPLPLRAVKRVAWKYMVPHFHYVKKLFPRIVMPAGFIDRALTLKGLADAYQTVNIWDLARYVRHFPDKNLDLILRNAADFTQKSGLLRYWKENKPKRHALGFWAEALYHLCLARPDQEYRVWLAQIMIDLQKLSIGLPPTLLGANADGVKLRDQLPCPSPGDVALRVANLSRGDDWEILVVNASDEPRDVTWGNQVNATFTWVDENGIPVGMGPTLHIGPSGWLWGKGHATV